jgi:GTP cyclohydrolase II
MLARFLKLVARRACVEGRSEYGRREDLDGGESFRRDRGSMELAVRSDGVSCLASATLPTRFGEFRIAVFQVDGTGDESPALIYGDLHGDAVPLVRLHSECLTGDVLGSMRCDCGEQLSISLEQIAEYGVGVLLYLRQEGRGIGLVNKIRAYSLQDTGLDTVDANLALGLPVDAREYGSAAAILQHLGLREIRLLTNNPAKLRALQLHGVDVVERVPIEIRPNSANQQYLKTKAVRMGHLLARNGSASKEDLDGSVGIATAMATEQAEGR